MRDEQLFMVILVVVFIFLFGMVVSDYQKSDSKKKDLSNFCVAITKKKEPCRNYRVGGTMYCYQHEPSDKIECVICYSKKNQRIFIKLKCGHEFCKTCLKTQKMLEVL